MELRGFGGELRGFGVELRGFWCGTEGGGGTEGVCEEVKGTRFGFKVYDLSTVDSEQVHT